MLATKSPSHALVAGCAWHRRRTGTDLVYDVRTGRRLPDVPYASVRTHGICQDCFVSMMDEIVSEPACA